MYSSSDVHRMFQNIRSILQDVTSEVIRRQKWRINLGTFGNACWVIVYG